MADKKTAGNETLFEGDDANDEGDKEILDLDDVTSGNLIQIDPGEEAQFVVKEVRKNHNPRFELSDVDYCIEIVDADGEIFPISAWVLWGQIKAAFREAQEEGYIDSTAGLGLKIQRGTEDGEYEVYWTVPELDEWHHVEEDEG